MRQTLPVNDNLRVASVVGLLFASGLAWLFVVVACADMARRGSTEFEGKPLWLGVVVVAILAFIADWLAWRVTHPKVNASSTTAIPAWFIWLFAGFGAIAGGWLVALDPRVPLVTKILSLPAIVAVVIVLRMQRRKAEALIRGRALTRGEDRTGPR